jgi:hypothetical protein
MGMGAALLGTKALSPQAFEVKSPGVLLSITLGKRSFTPGGLSRFLFFGIPLHAINLHENLKLGSTA